MCFLVSNLHLSFVKIDGFHGIFIYFYSQELAGWLFERFTDELGPHAYKDNIEK